MIAHLFTQFLDQNGVSIIFNPDLSQPVEISDFVSAYAGSGRHFERQIKEVDPDPDGEVKG